MVSANQIRKLIAAFVERRDDLRAFGRKFSELSYNIHKNGDQHAIALCNDVETVLADFAAGVIVRDELNALLAVLLPTNKEVVFALHAQREIILPPLNVLVEAPSPLASVFAGRSPGVVSGSEVPLPGTGQTSTGHRLELQWEVA